MTACSCKLREETQPIAHAPMGLQSDFKHVASRKKRITRTLKDTTQQSMACLRLCPLSPNCSPQGRIDIAAIHKLRVCTSNNPPMFHVHSSQTEQVGISFCEKFLELIVGGVDADYGICPQGNQQEMASCCFFFFSGPPDGSSRGHSMSHSLPRPGQSCDGLSSNRVPNKMSGVALVFP